MSRRRGFLETRASVRAMGEKDQREGREERMSAKARKAEALRRRREILHVLLKVLRGA